MKHRARRCGACTLPDVNGAARQLPVAASGANAAHRARADGDDGRHGRSGQLGRCTWAEVTDVGVDGFVCCRLENAMVATRSYKIKLNEIILFAVRSRRKANKQQDQARGHNVPESFPKKSPQPRQFICTLWASTAIVRLQSELLHSHSQQPTSGIDRIHCDSLSIPARVPPP